MKHLPLLLVLTAGLALGFVAFNSKDPSYVVPGEGSGVPKRLPQLTDGLVTQRFAVDGMCGCSGCPEKLYAAVRGTQGVVNAAVDPAIGQVSVQALPGTDPQTIVKALTFEKYTARCITETP